MKSVNALLSIAACGFSLNAFAACEQPPIVMLPSEQEDISGREEEILESTQEYFQLMQEYVACIQEELNSAGEDAPSFYRSVLIQRNNAAVAEAEAVQRWFSARFEGDATVQLPPEDD